MPRRHVYLDNLEEKPNILGLKCTMEDGADYPGNDIREYGKILTLEECCDLCKQNPSCKLFVWEKDKPANRWWLKDQQGVRCDNPYCM